MTPEKWAAYQRAFDAVTLWSWYRGRLSVTVQRCPWRVQGTRNFWGLPGLICVQIGPLAIWWAGL